MKLKDGILGAQNMAFILDFLTIHVQIKVYVNSNMIHGNSIAEVSLSSL